MIFNIGATNSLLAFGTLGEILYLSRNLALTLYDYKSSEYLVANDLWYLRNDDLSENIYRDVVGLASLVKSVGFLLLGVVWNSF